MKANGKVVLITGAARRVGACIARRLAAAGCDLLLHYRHSAAAAEALATELQGDHSIRVHLLGGDLADPGLPSRLIHEAVGHFGRLDGLVNNASLYQATPLDELDIAAWERIQAVNLRAPLFLARAAAPHLRHSQGAIVNMGDIYAERPLAGYLPYSVSKAGLIALTRALAKELGPEVRVNTVSPGVALWAESERPAEGDRRSILQRTALKREGSPEDIAGAVAYLLFDAPYVTGHNLVVDGGRMVY